MDVVDGSSYGPAEAAYYDSDAEHMLAPGEAELWINVLSHGLGYIPSHLLDFGAGTGLLMAALRRRGFGVIGFEPSTAMIEQGLSRGDGLRREDFILGNMAEPAAFATGQFDAIVCRQVLCHLSSPQTVFTAWRNWLRPGGICVAVDGFWSRSSWTADELAAQPFAALTDADPVVRALRSAGFETLHAGQFVELNEARRATSAGSLPRYIVVARNGAQPIASAGNA